MNAWRRAIRTSPAVSSRSEFNLTLDARGLPARRARHPVAGLAFHRRPGRGITWFHSWPPKSARRMPRVNRGMMTMTPWPSSPSPTWPRTRRFTNASSSVRACPGSSCEGRRISEPRKMSHAWAVSGRRSATRPILESDPQLTLSSPPFFYEFHLAAGAH